MAIDLNNNNNNNNKKFTSYISLVGFGARKILNKLSIVQATDYQDNLLQFVEKLYK